MDANRKHLTEKDLTAPERELIAKIRAAHLNPEQQAQVITALQGLAASTETK